MLSQFATAYEQVKGEDADILAIGQDSREQCATMKGRLRLSFPVLADEDGRIHREVGALDEQGRATAAVYITDKFGEILGVYRIRENQVLPPGWRISLTGWSSLKVTGPSASVQNGRRDCFAPENVRRRRVRIPNSFRIVSVLAPELDLRWQEDTKARASKAAAH